MTFQIRANGRLYTVRTEVGDGLAKVVFEEVLPVVQPKAEAPTEGTS